MIGAIKSRMRWVEHLAHTAEERKDTTVLGKPLR
jgi:hypothetical protein